MADRKWLGVVVEEMEGEEEEKNCSQNIIINKKLINNEKNYATLIYLDYYIPNISLKQKLYVHLV